MFTTRRIVASSAGVLTLAIAVVPASARPLHPATVYQTGRTMPAATYDHPDRTMVSVPPASNAAASVAKATVPQTVARIQAPENGFDWVDAGVGAAGGLALSFVAVGAGLGASQRRGRAALRRTA